MASVALPILTLAAIVACVTAWPTTVPERLHRIANVPGAQAVGAEECGTCHEDIEGHAPIPAYHSDCEACHGGGSLHVDSEKPADIRFPTADDCLSCHEKGRTTHMDFATGEHSRAGLICADCHNPHNREPHHVRVVQAVSFPQMEPNSKLCIGCHADVAARLHYPSHHPVAEGMLSCIDCHSPHEDRRAALGDKTQLCAGCHQDHVGPWIYEHPPVTEDCMICHNPHGTAAFNLLETNVPAICLSCHTPADDPHLLETGDPAAATITTDAPTLPGQRITALGASAVYTRCTDCHGAIHGSMQDHHLWR
ncbi:MAG: cytochrome c3 family protein [Myxococcota bacterium]